MNNSVEIRTTGVHVSRLGLGTVPLAGFGKETSYAEFEEVVMAAFEAGYRYFDTAPMYGSGRAEMFLGQVLRSNGIRDQVTIATKVGRLLSRKTENNQQKKFRYGGGIVWQGGFPFVQGFDYSYDGIMRSVEDSFQRFGMDHFDVVHVHDIGVATHSEEENALHWRSLHEGGLRALDEIRASGAAGAIGIGVNETAAAVELADAFDLDCVSLAGRYSLLNHEPLAEFFPDMARRGVSVIAAGVFNSGILGGGVKGGTRTFDYMEAPAEIIERVSRIEDVCARHDVSLPEAALQFVSAHPVIVNVLLGCKNSDEVRQNARAMARTAPADFWEDLRDQGLIPKEAPVPAG